MSSSPQDCPQIPVSFLARGMALSQASATSDLESSYSDSLGSSHSTSCTEAKSGQSPFFGTREASATPNQCFSPIVPPDLCDYDASGIVSPKKETAHCQSDSEAQILDSRESYTYEEAVALTQSFLMDERRQVEHEFRGQIDELSKHYQIDRRLWDEKIKNLRAERDDWKVRSDFHEEWSSDLKQILDQATKNMEIHYGVLQDQHDRLKAEYATMLQNWDQERIDLRNASHQWAAQCLTMNADLLRQGYVYAVDGSISVLPPPPYSISATS